MRDLRDTVAQGSTKFRALCTSASFGSSSTDTTTMSDEALALQNNYPEGNNVQEYLDKNIYTRLLLCSAEASAEYFRTTLSHLFSGANVQKGHLKSKLHDPEALTIIFAPVKGLERTLVKFDEYAIEA